MQQQCKGEDALYHVCLSSLYSLLHMYESLVVVPGRLGRCGNTFKVLGDVAKATDGRTAHCFPCRRMKRRSSRR